MGAAGAVAGIQILGNIQEGMAVREMALKNAKISRMKSRIAEEQAKASALEQSRRSRKVLGTMQADYAASGVTSDSGSVLDVIEESATAAELDRQNILYRGKLESMGYELEAEVYGAQAGQAAVGMFFGSASTALTTASKPKPKPTTQTSTG